MGDPCHDPRGEGRVVVVEPLQPAGGRGERPGMENCQPDEQDQFGQSTIS
jgi:hypothetical protein